MRTPSITIAALAVSSLLAVASASAVVISDNFSGYPASATTNLSINPGGGGQWLGAVPGYGPIGAEWLGGWRNSSNNTNGNNSSYILNTSPLVTGGGNYISYTVNTATGNAFAGSSLTRAYNATEISSSGTAAFSTTFDFRADSFTGGPVRFNLSNSYNRTPNYDSSATWVLSAYNGLWYAGNGPGANFVSTGMAFTAGVTFSLAITENPVTKLWDLTISNGTTSNSLTGLNYRTAAWAAGDDSVPDARWLTFSASETGTTSVGASATFSVDNVVLTSIPEPSTAILLGVATLGAAFMLRRRS